eukprot:Gb_23461 [translate_table: standard]
MWYGKRLGCGNMALIKLHCRPMKRTCRISEIPRGSIQLTAAPQQLVMPLHSLCNQTMNLGEKGRKDATCARFEKIIIEWPRALSAWDHKSEIQAHEDKDQLQVAKVGLAYLKML